MSARRDGERGLSIIEAIVIATITALLALMIMPLLPRASAGSFATAERGIDGLDRMRAEREFRALVRAVSVREVDGEPQPVIEGAQSSVVFRPNLSVAASCARAGAPVVELSVGQNALFCTSEGRRRTVTRWSSGRVGVLSYSADGTSWFTSWGNPAIAPYVRFEIRRGRRTEASWVERIAGDLS